MSQLNPEHTLPVRLDYLLPVPFQQTEVCRHCSRPFDYEIYLNGEKVKNCVYASEPLAIVLVIEDYKKTGDRIADVKAVTKLLTGKVEIRAILTESGSPE